MFVKIIAFLLLLIPVESYSQSSKPVRKVALVSPAGPKLTGQPKLVVGLVVDQMRWDYLYRYRGMYGNDGFERLLKSGFSCENTMIPYLPTYTAPGHTCVYTGSIPAIHGIVGNNWYNRKTGKSVYCTDDDTAQTVGSTSSAGRMSPANMWTTTITDELRLSTNFKSKVIGIALKDRGAILPAGHSANAAYWYDDRVGKWISSTHYMNALPEWVNQFNAKDYPAQYMRGTWNTLLPVSKYDLSTADAQTWESGLGKSTWTSFPHQLNEIEKTKQYDAFKTTPFANTYTLDFAKATIDAEKLGMNSVPDFLAVSISSTDYIGHSFGPNSIEAQDTYLRLDQDLAAFLAYLDAKVGKGNYLFFLTADHGAAHVPAFLNDHKIPAGVFDDKVIEDDLNRLISAKLNITKAVSKVMNYQVYISDSGNTQREDVIKLILTQLKKGDSLILDAYELEEIAEATLVEPLKSRTINGFASTRSGDVQFFIKPAYFDGGKKGTTHGLWNPYDAHIPLLFFGWNIQPGKTHRETYMTDISATLAALLQIQVPNGCVGHAIGEVVK